MSIKSYSELITIPTFKERIEYLQTGNIVGNDIFGFNRWMNQKFYRSVEWRNFRDKIIIRDNGCDLACLDRPIPDGVKVIIHHINAININDISKYSRRLMDPDNVITTIHDTHNMIHYGFEPNDIGYVERKPNDTIPWRK